MVRKTARRDSKASNSERGNPQTQDGMQSEGTG